MDRAIGQLQLKFLSPEQIAASRAIMGIDSQLIRDGTYFIVEEDGVLAGCGGWSRRATLYGGDHSKELRRRALVPRRRLPNHLPGSRHHRRGNRPIAADGQGFDLGRSRAKAGVQILFDWIPAFAGTRASR